MDSPRQSRPPCPGRRSHPYNRGWGRLPTRILRHSGLRPGRGRPSTFSMNETAPLATLEPPCPATPELPGADGIRWQLVERMKKRIVDGTLDTPDRWALAEELLLRGLND